MVLCAVGEGRAFSMGSGRLSTVAALAGTSFSTIILSLLSRRCRLRHQRNAKTAPASSMSVPMTAPASAPLLGPEELEEDELLESMHRKTSQLSQSLFAQSVSTAAMNRLIRTHLWTKTHCCCAVQVHTGGVAGHSIVVVHRCSRRCMIWE